MDLLFAIIFIASATSAVIAVVSFLAMPFQPVLWAIRSATVFVIGVVSGVALSGGLLFLFVGTGSTRNCIPIAHLIASHTAQ